MPNVSSPIPTLLRISQTLALVCAIFSTLVTVAFIIGSPYDSSFLDVLSPNGLLFMRALAIFCAYDALALFWIHHGIKHRRAWARPLIVAFLTLWQVGNITVSLLLRTADGLWSADFTPLFLSVPVVWYLYFKPNVAAYFASLRAAPTAPSVA